GKAVIFYAKTRTKAANFTTPVFVALYGINMNCPSCGIKNKLT
ncbi:MAG: hypothetical protein ACI822_001867, partial [Gammaproteobacteria bacterium]